MRILIVDDCKEYREIVEKHVKKTKGNGDITCDNSDCLTDALVKIKETDYDIIILDLKLPETEGLETIDNVFWGLEDANKEIPVIILTGTDDYKIGKKAYKKGIRDYLIKGDEEEGKKIRRAVSFANYAKKLPLKK
ncbi:MAG: response regulator [Clostridiales bacterium]|nr:response regulator [Clostridiales bacterium]